MKSLSVSTLIQVTFSNCPFVLYSQVRHCHLFLLTRNHRQIICMLTSAIGLLVVLTFDIRLVDKTPASINLCKHSSQNLGSLTRVSCAVPRQGWADPTGPCLAASASFPSAGWTCGQSALHLNRLGLGRLAWVRNHWQLTEKGYGSGRMCSPNRLSFLSFGLGKGSRENGRKAEERA